MVEFFLGITIIGLGYVFSNPSKNKKETFMSDDMNNDTNRYDEGWKVINDKAKLFKNIPEDVNTLEANNSGTILNNKFEHNNMVPFFGSKITQNVSEKGTKSLFNRPGATSGVATSCERRRRSAA